MAIANLYNGSRSSAARVASTGALATDSLDSNPFAADRRPFITAIGCPVTQTVDHVGSGLDERAPSAHARLHAWLAAGAAVVLTSALAFMPAPAQAADSMSHDQYKAEKDRISQTYKEGKTHCDSMKGNAKDVCMQQAKADRDVALAELDQRNEPSPRHAEKVATAKADGAYDVAKEKCDDLAGNSKDLCVREAKTAHEKALADAKVMRTSAKQQEVTREARQDARSDKREADYKLALQRCDSLAGSAKDACTSDAKARFDRN